MNLKKQYQRAHTGRSSLWAHRLGQLVISLGLVYLVNLLWNYLAPVWGLPQLSYPQLLGTLALLHLLTSFLGFNATQQDAYPNEEFIKILGEPPYEQK
jgi:hypothetical protein